MGPFPASLLSVHFCDSQKFHHQDNPILQKNKLIDYRDAIVPKLSETKWLNKRKKFKTGDAVSGKCKKLKAQSAEPLTLHTTTK